MRIVYRMRGLLGDATEEFIENLDTKDNEEVDNEEVYKMANVMSECGGLEVMLERMSTITDLSRGRSLLTVLLKLFGFCIKVWIILTVILLMKYPYFMDVILLLYKEFMVLLVKGVFEI